MPGKGRSRVLVVCGEAGVGKTALLDDAVERAAGMQVVRAVGVESETTMPFGALFDVCRSFLGSIGDLPDRRAAAHSRERWQWDPPATVTGSRSAPQR